LLLLLWQIILEALDTHLVMFSPYISLTKLLESDAQLADLSQNAWAALNDVYRTDAPLVYAPHVLALGCLYLASVICSRDITAWLEGVDADINQVQLLGVRQLRLGGLHLATLASVICFVTEQRCLLLIAALAAEHMMFLHIWCLRGVKLASESKLLQSHVDFLVLLLLLLLLVVLQIYAVCSELINMYETYRVPISQEECRRLLAAVRPPQQAPAAAAAAGQQ
jgi:dihydroorotase-like cyclic amidohydrolase